MERSLDLGHISDALGEHTRLPPPDELQALMAELEVGLFIGQGDVSRDLLRSAWYLHGVASAPPASELYRPARQRRAFQVSAHIFDLALASSEWDMRGRLSLAFGAEVGYRRGELDPNALAVYRRVSGDVIRDRPIDERIDTLALEAGCALLGLDTRHLFQLFAQWQSRLRSLASQVQVDDLRGTVFGPSAEVVGAAQDLLHYLAFGRSERLEQAHTALTNVLAGEAGPADLDVRWVAAHLRQLGEELGSGSVWSALPPELPPEARQAFTLVDPPVLTLWQPQRELLSPSEGPSPLDRTVRRIVASVPTSGGKTLIGQLLVVHHLATRPSDVCFVAPWRSLAREVRQSLRRRLRLLEKELGDDVPDYGIGLPVMAEPGDSRPLIDVLRELADRLGADAQPAVEVMTPERLFHLLRRDASAVLARFGMFVFDETQLIAEPGRGFNLEALLSFLHWRTRDSDHRIALLSATMGNAGEMMTWLNTTGSGAVQSSDWRGPRRLDAIFTTAVDWAREERTVTRSAKNPVRLTYPLVGRIRLRPAEGGETRYLRLTEPVGEIAFRAGADGARRDKDAANSTPNYRSAARIVAALAHGGSVLVINSTRPAARRMAYAMAELLDPNPALRPLADSFRLRLGDEHPLVYLVGRGVGYHHAGLPADVLEELEEATRDDRLQFLAATSTLSEGVNLPVRTVVIAETRYDGQPEEARITGPRLINAMGRAGRAGRETEGWVVFIQAARERDSDFEVFNPPQEDLAVRSRLASHDALAALNEFEDLRRLTHDAVFHTARREAADFISFVWFLLAAEEALGAAPDLVELEGQLDATLAFKQLDADLQARWRLIAIEVRTAYLATDSDRRRRWARTGTSVPTARLLDELSDQLKDEAAGRPVDDLEAVDGTLALLGSLRVLERLLDTAEAPRWSPRQTESGPVKEVDVALVDVLSGWIRGESFQELADRLFADVPDRTWRLEQAVEIVSSFCEHFLSWTLGVLIELTNEKLEADQSDRRVCPQLPAYVRYGVDNDYALALLIAGVRSRRLAHVVSRQIARESPIPSDMRSWIASMSIPEWERRFAAAPSELLDLLDFARERRRSLLRTLLEEGEVRFPVEAVRRAGEELRQPVECDVRPMAAGPAPQPLGAFTRDSRQLLARIPSGVHADVNSILDTGLTIRSAFATEDGDSHIRLAFEVGELVS